MIRGRKRIVANKTRRKGVLRPREVEVAQVALSLGVARPDELHLDVVLREHVRAVMVACRKNVSLAAAVIAVERAGYPGNPRPEIVALRGSYCVDFRPSSSPRS